VSGSRYDFRLVHYLGSKLRLLDPIVAAVEEVTPPGGSVCDLFAGSGAVSLALSRQWSVTAVDIQEYSRVLCSAVLNPVADPDETGRVLISSARSGPLREGLRASLAELIDYERWCIGRAATGSMDELADLLDGGSLLASSEPSATALTHLGQLRDATVRRLRDLDLEGGPRTVVTRHFGGVYFSWEQAVDLDALLYEIHAQADGRTRDYFLAAVLAVASETVNSVGKQFAQPIRPRTSTGQLKHHLVRQTLRDRSIDIFDAFAGWLHRLKALPRGSLQHRALRRDFREAIADPNLRVGAVYADPPYTRDHYSRFYHALETMALHDEPDVSTTMIRSNGSPKLSRGVYRSVRHQSPFSIKSQAPSAFDALCAGVGSRGIPMVLSYSPFDPVARNRPRLLRVSEVVEIARRHFGSVDVREVEGLTHNKFNLAERNVDVDYVAEVMFVCTP
jgi:adenine-specific DNA methylase